jgi:predicted amidohydrolase
MTLDFRKGLRDGTGQQLERCRACYLTPFFWGLFWDAEGLFPGRSAFVRKLPFGTPVLPRRESCGRRFGRLPGALEYRLYAVSNRRGRQEVVDWFRNRSAERFFLAFAALARELSMNIGLTYLETHEPKPRNTISIIVHGGQVALKYSKVFICNFGQHELSKPNPNIAEIGCDFHCSPGVFFDVCALKGAEGDLLVGAMICADREFPEAATELMLKGAELIVIPNACTWDELRTAGLRTRSFENLVGAAMVNCPGPGAGKSQAHTCVAWKHCVPQDTLLASAADQEQILFANFDLEAIRAFRKEEAWRIDYRRNSARGSNPCSEHALLVVATVPELTLCGTWHRPHSR